MRLSLTLCALCACFTLSAQENLPGGADQKTPSKSEYFSWINHSFEGPTASQTQANLQFFEWLHRTYGMTLDIYAFDAGTIDGWQRYSTTTSNLFKRQFPEGFGSLASQAASMGTRLGLWCGPDGFGDTPEEEKERSEMMVGFARDYNFALFKMDACCGPLRPEKYGAFEKMMSQVRSYSPDLILLNHRLDLGPGTKYSTTYLLEGAETYIDVHMVNSKTATHHRAVALERKNPEGLTRLTEDHGVCLSSCLDYWEDDLILQAFSRELILAPEIYGNPWLLRDDEFSRLAFIFNLHRDYRDILPNATPLPEDSYGPEALSRGDGKTRFLALRNLTWEPVKYRINLGDEIGLDPVKGKVKARLYHPYILDLGSHEYGSSIEVEVLPFRAALVKLTTAPEKDILALSGVPYQIINDRGEGPGQIRLMGLPGTTSKVKWEKGGKGSFKVRFDGDPLLQPWHRKIGDMSNTEVPSDAQALYYATVYAADNNALELRSLKRSGETSIPEVQAARDAFFGQEIFRSREVTDRNMFDGDPSTAFTISRRYSSYFQNEESGLCIDMGQSSQMDSLVIEVPLSAAFGRRQPLDGIKLYLSEDLKDWKESDGLYGDRMSFDLRKIGKARFIRLEQCPYRITEITGFLNGKVVDRSLWRGSNLFKAYNTYGCRATKAWDLSFTLDEIADGSYLCVAVNGKHGIDGAWVAFKIDGEYVGCPDRAPSYLSNSFECPTRRVGKNNTFYLPLTPEMKGKKIEAYCLKLGNAKEEMDLSPEVWITSADPYKSKTITCSK